MLSIVRSKLWQLWSRIRLLVWRRPRPKVIIRRLGKINAKDRCRWKPGLRKSSLYLSRKVGLSSSERPIRIATFNVAMFSLAPAVPEVDESVLLNPEHEDYMIFQCPVKMDTEPKSANYYPKGILKQSPLHTGIRNADQLSPHNNISRSKPKVSIDLPDDQISLAHGKFTSLVEEERDGSSNIIASRNYRSNFVMRSPVCLPAKMIHNTSDQESLKSSRSVVEVLKEVDADILALQDVKAQEENNMRPLSDLAASLGMRYVFAESWAPEYGNAILSKWPIKKWRVQKIANDDDFRNVLKATICVPWAGELDIYCTQLDHLDENWRMKQIGAIIQSNDCPHILAGGLNSLDGSDYSSERWMDIVKYYEDIGKPTPRNEVTKFLKGKGFTDAKESAGECEPVVMIAKGQSVQGTCKYGTRVDYVLTSPGMEYKFVPGSYSVISSKGTSDHHIVKADVRKVVRDHQGSSVRRPRKAIRRFLRTNNICWPSPGIWKLNT